MGDVELQKLLSRKIVKLFAHAGAPPALAMEILLKALITLWTVQHDKVFDLDEEAFIANVRRTFADVRHLMQARRARAEAQSPSS